MEIFFLKQTKTKQNHQTPNPKATAFHEAMYTAGARSMQAVRPTGGRPHECSECVTSPRVWHAAGTHQTLATCTPSPPPPNQDVSPLNGTSVPEPASPVCPSQYSTWEITYDPRLNGHDDSPHVRKKEGLDTENQSC